MLQMKSKFRVEIVSRFDNDTHQIKHDIELMNALGADGWILLSTATMGQMVYGYFAKPDTITQPLPTGMS